MISLMICHNLASRRTPLYSALPEHNDSILSLRSQIFVSRRFPTFCVHIWDRIAHIAEQHQWSPCTAGGSLINNSEGIAVHGGGDNDR